MFFQYIPTNSQLVIRSSSQFYDVFQQDLLGDWAKFRQNGSEVGGNEFPNVVDWTRRDSAEMDD